MDDLPASPRSALSRLLGLFGGSRRDPDDPQGEERPRLPGWKRFLLKLAVASVVLGLGLHAYGALRGPGEDGPSKPSYSPPGPAGTSTLVVDSRPIPDTTGGESVSREPEGLASWSPFFLRNGFSFTVAFCVGYALRAFFKISALTLGVVFLGLFGLSYLGVLDVDWGTLKEHFDSIGGRIREEADSFVGFIKGSLPSAASGGFGLLVGLKKN